MSSYILMHRALNSLVAAVYDRRCLSKCHKHPADDVSPSRAKRPCCSSFLPFLFFFVWLLLFIGRAHAIDASFPAAWSGATGATDGLLLPVSDRSPVELFEQGITGRARVLYVPPGAKAPQGSYSASLTLYDNGSVHTFRGTGVPGADGSIQATWTYSGKTPGSVAVKLSRLPLDPQALILQGEAVVGSRRYPFFLVPEQYSKTVPFTASSAVTGPGVQSFFVQHPTLAVGAGSGFATIGADGTAKFAGILADGSKVSLSAPILVGGGRHFLAAAGVAGKGGFFGGWAHADRTQSESDWRGAALTAAVGQAPREGLDFLLAAFNPAAAPVLPWTRGLLHAEFNPYFFVATGTVAFDGRSRFAAEPRPDVADDDSRFLNGANASGVRINSLTLDPRKGLVKGLIGHLSGPAALRSTLTGALNQKSGVITGRIAPRTATDAPGFFDIRPNP